MPKYLKEPFRIKQLAPDEEEKLITLWNELTQVVDACEEEGIASRSGNLQSITEGSDSTST